MDPKKVANNILEFLIDPTVIPVRERLYFRPEEILKNDVYEGAKAEAQKAYRDQKHNSDFYPIRNRQQQTGKFSTERKETLMDRKTMIASLDVFSENFNENDPIGKDLRTMAVAIAGMSDETFEARLSPMTVEAKKKMKFVECPKCGNKKVICMKCKGEGLKDKEAGDEEKPVVNPDKPAVVNPDETEEQQKEATEINDFWSKEASEAVAQALIQDVLGEDQNQRAMKNWPAGGGSAAPAVEEAPAPAEEAPVEEAPAEEAPAEEAAPAKKAPAPAKKPEEEAEEGETEEACVNAEVPPELEKKDPKDQPKDQPQGKEVDTSMIYAGIDMEAGMITEADMEAITPEEKSRLDLLFQ